MDGRCHVHGFEVGEACCRNCGFEFCSECLVYAFGASKPPYCISCALTAAGVRSNAARRPSASKRQIRKMEKERRKAEKVQKETPRVEVSTTPIVEITKAEDDENPFAWADDPDSDQRVPF